MEKKDIIIELKELNKQLKAIENRIEFLINEINKEKTIESNPLFSNIVKNEKNGVEFLNFLQNVKHLKEGSIKDYFGELRKIREKFLEFLNVSIPFEIYEIDDLSIIKKLITMFNNSGDFIQLNLKSHHSLSAAINNYEKFLEYHKTAFVLDED